MKQIFIRSILKVFPHFFEFRDYIFDEPKYCLKLKRRFTINDGYLYKKFSIPHKNVFYGYYDLQQIKDNKCLVHVTPKNANPKVDRCEIGYFDEYGNYNYITATNAWCWQQGARLQWLDKVEPIISFNDFRKGKYITVLYNVDKKEERIISYPCYEISKTRKFGLSLNFTRLQQLRPGYGYSCMNLDRAIEKAPEDDGLFYVDFNNDTNKLLVSLRQLSEQIDYDKEGKYVHYLNHISLSPDENQIMFFHIMKHENINDTRIRMMIYNLVSGEIKCVEEKLLPSHYTWKNENMLLATMIDKSTSVCRYYEIDLLKNKTKMVGELYLTEDGHPTYLCDGCIITDTYRHSRSNYQELYVYDFDNIEKIVIGKFYHSPFMRGELRCDLHPRVNGKEIIIDTIFDSKLRCCILLKERG